jgi:hypothetical protein
MCGLCGVLGGPAHWADAAARPGGFDRGDDELQRRHERRLRVALAAPVLAHFGLKLDDWQGSSFQLANRTGSSELVDDLAHLWAAAERLSGRACDPLDPLFVAAFEAGHARDHRA